jgi:hypothetical protein
MRRLHIRRVVGGLLLQYHNIPLMLAGGNAFLIDIQRSVRNTASPRAKKTSGFVDDVVDALQMHTAGAFSYSS